MQITPLMLKLSWKNKKDFKKLYFIDTCEISTELVEKILKVTNKFFISSYSRQFWLE